MKRNKKNTINDAEELKLKKVRSDVADVTGGFQLY